MGIHSGISPSNDNMKHDVREGTYVGKRGKEFMDYMIKCGCPPSDASKMMENGMTMRAEVSKIGERKWRGVITCEEVPQMNDTHTYEEDKEVSIDDPMFGGKIKVRMICPSENTIRIWLDHS